MDLVSQFDKAVASLTDDVIAKMPEGRTALESSVRMHCCRLIDEQLALFREASAHREQLSMARQDEKNKSTRRVLEIKEHQHQEVVATLMSKVKEGRQKRRRSADILVTRGDESKRGNIVHFLFLFWRTTVHADLLRDSAKYGFKSARRRQESQENDPPRNGANHAIQALPRPPPHTCSSSDRPVLQSADCPAAATVSADRPVAMMMVAQPAPHGQVQSPSFPPREMQLRRQQSASTSWLPDAVKPPGVGDEVSVGVECVGGATEGLVGSYLGLAATGPCFHAVCTHGAAVGLPYEADSGTASVHHPKCPPLLHGNTTSKCSLQAGHYGSDCSMDDGGSGKESQIVSPMWATRSFGVAGLALPCAAPGAGAAGPCAGGHQVGAGCRVPMVQQRVPSRGLSPPRSPPQPPASPPLSSGRSQSRSLGFQGIGNPASMPTGITSALNPRHTPRSASINRTMHSAQSSTAARRSGSATGGHTQSPKGSFVAAPGSALAASSSMPSQGSYAPSIQRHRSYTPVGGNPTGPANCSPLSRTQPTQAPPAPLARVIRRH